MRANDYSRSSVERLTSNLSMPLILHHQQGMRTSSSGKLWGRREWLRVSLMMFKDCSMESEYFFLSLYTQLTYSIGIPPVNTWTKGPGNNTVHVHVKTGNRYLP